MISRVAEALALSDLLAPAFMPLSHQPRPWQGAAPRQRRGRGTEFWQFRPYTAGMMPPALRGGPRPDTASP